MTTEQLKLSEQAGCDTVRETSIWYLGYLAGKSEVYTEVMADLDADGNYKAYDLKDENDTE